MLSRIWGREAGGATPPALPCFPGGSAPLTPPKGAPRPWLQQLFAFSRPSHLCGTAALPGAELVLRNPTFFFNEPLVPGSFTAWGRTFSQNMFFEEATCPRQLRCLGQNFFWKTDFVFLNKPLVPGSFAAWGRTFSQKSDLLFEEATCPGQLRCLGQNFFSETGLF